MRRNPVLSIAVALILILAGCTKKDVLLSNQALKDISAGNYRQAEADLQKALSINSKNPYALLNLGVVYQNTDRPQKAREMYERVVALDPKEKAATSNQVDMAGMSLVDIAKKNLELLEAQEGEKRKRAEGSAAPARDVRQEMATRETAAAPPPPPPPPEPRPSLLPLRPEVQPGPPPAAPARPGQYKTEKGDSLTHVAARKEVYGDPLMWTSLFRLNPEVLKFAGENDALPYRKLPPGTELRFVTGEKAEAERMNLKNRYWAVNVASIEQERLMGVLVVPLVKSGYRPYITETKVKGVGFRRLRVGFFKDRSEAVAAAKSIQRTLKLTARPWVQEVAKEEFERYAGY